MLHEDVVRRVASRDLRVVVVGQGYVGLPVAMRCAEVGFSVVGFDTDGARIEQLRAGNSYVEDVSRDVLRAALTAGYSPMSDGDALGEFDVAVITVPTPLRDGVPDLAFVAAAGACLAQQLTRGALVILESTTYPGTTEELLLPILESSGLKAGQDFLLGYSPERIDPGNPQYNFVNTPKVVSGVDGPSLLAVEAFYGALVNRVVAVASTREAELVKLLENTFRHVNIALVNEVAMFASELDVDVWSAIEAASTKPFGYMTFKPGPGVGGHCLPIDPSYLSWSVKRRSGRAFRFVELANDINEHMPLYVVSRIQRLLNRHRCAVNGSKILLLGVTYKAGSSDARESPSAAVARELLELGAEVAVCDPYALSGSEPPGTRVEPFGIDALAAADLVVVLVDHSEFDPDAICEHARLVFDAKGHLSGRDFDGESL
jgi:nucleotide sugar dehydrogenase